MSISSTGSRNRPIRIIGSGTIFFTHVLSLQTFPDEGTSTRAKAVVKSRGGSAANVLATLGQFENVHAMLVAPLAGSSEGTVLVKDLQRENVDTRYCRVWEGAHVPSAWIIEAEDTSSRTIVNHNPLPDITHEEFVSLLGPMLVPENYGLEHASNLGTPPQQTSGQGQIRAPFDWLHFEGRSVKTTLSNIVGIDGLARERRWRERCVFSLDACKTRQGVEALIPHADVIFFSKHYALSQNAAYTTPRPFLLALASSGRVPPHALLVAFWGSEGAALLSMPTREYLQSSGWFDDEPRSTRPLSTISDNPSGTFSDSREAGAGSVRSGSGFWAAGHRAGSGTSSSAFTAFSAAQSSQPRDSYIDSGPSDIPQIRAQRADSDRVSEVTELETRDPDESLEVYDEASAQDAFMAGMIFTLGQRILPGYPYTPVTSYIGQNNGAGTDLDRGKWRLEDCLRFASELAGRRARKYESHGLADEMRRSGWFDTI